MYRKSHEWNVPVLAGDDEDVLVWLIRESAEKWAAAYLLEVVEFTDLGEVAVEDIPPRGVKQLGEAYVGCRFRRFRVVAERPASA